MYLVRVCAILGYCWCAFAIQLVGLNVARVFSGKRALAHSCFFVFADTRMRGEKRRKRERGERVGGRAFVRESKLPCRRVRQGAKRGTEVALRPTIAETCARACISYLRTLSLLRVYVGVVIRVCARVCRLQWQRLTCLVGREWSVPWKLHDVGQRLLLADKKTEEGRTGVSWRGAG